MEWLCLKRKAAGHQMLYSFCNKLPLSETMRVELCLFIIEDPLRKILIIKFGHGHGHGHLFLMSAGNHVNLKASAVEDSGD